MDKLLDYTFQYYWVDWIVTLTVFAWIFLLGDKKKPGFIMWMISAFFGIIFSFQITSIANWIASVVLFYLYLRGYIKWRDSEKRKIKRPL